LLQSRNLTGFGYSRVNPNPLMFNGNPLEIVKEKSKSTLRYLYVDGSALFQADDMNNIPNQVEDLTLINQTNLGWEALEKLPPSIKSLRFVNNSHTLVQKPETISFPPELQSLTISYKLVDEGFMRSLPHTSLKSLTLENADSLTGDILEKLPQGLESLSFRSCTFMGPSLFTRLPGSLQRFEAVHSNGLTPKDVSTVNNRPYTTMIVEAGDYTYF